MKKEIKQKAQESMAKLQRAYEAGEISEAEFESGSEFLKPFLEEKKKGFEITPDTINRAIERAKLSTTNDQARAIGNMTRDEHKAFVKEMERNRREAMAEEENKRIELHKKLENMSREEHMRYLKDLERQQLEESVN